MTVELKIFSGSIWEFDDVTCTHSIWFGNELLQLHDLSLVTDTPKLIMIATVLRFPPLLFHDIVQKLLIIFLSLIF